jgi:hypothetical protein
MTRTTHRLSAGVAVAFWLVIAGQVQASPARPRYRVDLAGGASVIALDVPVRHGTVYTFHDGENGVLTGLPAEQVVEVEVLPMVDSPVAHLGRRPSIEFPEFVRPLEPGEMLVIGPTGDGALPAPDTTGAAAAGGQAQAAVPGPNPYGYGGYVAPTPRIVGPNGVPTALSSTDLSQALASTTAPNGFPATTSSPTTIGPNGTPTLSPGMPGSDLPIGPNGFPQTFTPPVIGPDGLPVLAPSGTPSASQPVIGSNGTPVSAPAGAPGATQSQIGSNGTPILAPPGGPGTAGPSIGPNGFPTVPAQAPGAIVAPKAAAAPAAHGSGH